MTDREKLIELIEENDRRCCGAICEVCSYTKEGNVCQSAMLADHLIANGVTVQKWIPASEPPENRGEYIVMIKGARAATMLWYNPNRKTWEEFDTPYNVTHWMPLPEPPKETE